MKRLKKAQAEQIAHALFEFTWSAPLETYLDTEMIRSVLDDATDSSAINDDFIAYFHDALRRQTSSQKLWSLTGDDLLHEETQSVLEKSLRRNRALDEDLVRKVLKHELVSLVLRRLVERILEAFVDGFMNREAGSLGGVSRSAFGFAARASKGLFEKVSAQIEAPLRQAMATFVQGSMDRLRQQLGDILKSNDVQELLGDARLRVFHFVMKQPIKTWQDAGLSDEELSELLTTMPATLGKLAKHETIRTILEAEIEYLLDAYGKTPIGDLLPEQATTSLADQLRTRIEANWSLFFGSKMFVELIQTELD